MIPNCAIMSPKVTPGEKKILGNYCSICIRYMILTELERLIYSSLLTRDPQSCYASSPMVIHPICTSPLAPLRLHSLCYNNNIRSYLEMLTPQDGQSNLSSPSWVRSTWRSIFACSAVSWINRMLIVLECFPYINAAWPLTLGNVLLFCVVSGQVFPVRKWRSRLDPERTRTKRNLTLKKCNQNTDI